MQNPKLSDLAMNRLMIWWQHLSEGRTRVCGKILG